MTKPLSEILGLVKREHSRHYGNVCDCGASGHKDALNDLDQRVPSVVELTKILNKVILGEFNHIKNPKSKDYEQGMKDATKIMNEMFKEFIIPKMAQEAIDSMDKWITKG